MFFIFILASKNCFDENILIKFFHSEVYSPNTLNIKEIIQNCFKEEQKNIYFQSFPLAYKRVEDTFNYKIQYDSLLDSLKKISFLNGEDSFWRKINLKNCSRWIYENHFFFNSRYNNIIVKFYSEKEINKIGNQGKEFLEIFKKQEEIKRLRKYIQNMEEFWKKNYQIIEEQNEILKEKDDIINIKNYLIEEKNEILNTKNRIIDNLTSEIDFLKKYLLNLEEQNSLLSKKLSEI